MVVLTACPRPAILISFPPTCPSIRFPVEARPACPRLPDARQAKGNSMSNTRFVPLRTAALCACLLPFALLTGCGGGSSSTPVTPVNTGPVTSAPRSSNGLQYTLTADKSVYKVGEAVNLTYTSTNTSTQPITDVIGLPNVFATVTQGNQVIWRTPALVGTGGAGFGPSSSIPPGASSTYQATWPQTIGTSGTQAAPGQYAITATLNDTAIGQPTNPIQITIVP